MEEILEEVKRWIKKAEDDLLVAREMLLFLLKALPFRGMQNLKT